ncbi:MAG TPA: pentapeptide repeat-containing protein [Gaiellaceae bacterium]|nr:pentapeptide repeat-containing protein [Gaiellaceae bacterium]
MFSTAVIAAAGILLLVGTIVPGVRLWWPQHRDPVSRSDLGVALMTGALIAFAVLAVQVLIQIRSQRDANTREDQADRAALLLQLGRSANLSDLDLQGKDLSNAYLKGKDLSGANLSGASMVNASLQDSKLVGANLSDASLERAQLQRADLRYAALGRASLVRVKLTGGNLDAATLTPDVDLTRADLSNASARADLRKAVFAYANLVGARLDRANLQEADFTGAEMQFVDLRGADLRGANLLRASDLDQARDLSLARFDRRTRWPPTFYWPPQTSVRPRCREPICILRDSPAELHELPPGLIAIRERLERAANDGECLPGWVVEDRPDRIEAYAPRHRATFSVLTRNLPGTPPRIWAQESILSNVEPIPSVTVGGPPKRIYAVRAADLESSQPYRAVHVWFFRGPAQGFHAWAEAPPMIFALFERDFTKLFGAVGVEGGLFPWLRGGELKCRS